MPFKPSSGYRKDIDGLRAIAITLVVLYHAGFSCISSGFIGVDMFFLISGYLISGVILKKIKNNNFSLKEFYIHRLRRLAPAFTVVTLTTSCLAFYILLPTALMMYAKSLESAYLAVSNIFFWRYYSGYFSLVTNQVPLLHTWSLSVEEQYYFLMPISVMVFRKILKKTIFRHIFIILTLLLSIWLSQWGALNKAGIAYYALPTRFFELFMGCCLTYYWDNIPKLNKAINHVVSIIGLLLIIASGAFLKNNVFPGFNAIYPCLGAVLIILTGKHYTGIINKIISTKAFTFIGLISYSMYLWHWPIFAYLNYIDFSLNTSYRIIIIIFIVFISYLTWRCVELPFRFKYIFNLRNSILFLYVLPLLAATLFVFFNLSSNGFPNRFNSSLAHMGKATESYSEKARGKCNDGPFKNPLPEDKCRLGFVEKPTVDALLIGDSHANAMAGMIGYLLEKASLRGYDVTQSVTAYLPGMERRGIGAVGFKERNDALTHLIKEKKYKFVILGGNWPLYKNTFFSSKSSTLNQDNNSYKLLKNGLNNALKIITNAGSTPVIIMDVPSIKEISPSCNINKIRWKKKTTCAVSFEKFIKSQDQSRAALLELKSAWPSIVYIYPEKISCDQNSCFANINDTPLYKDSEHLNYIGSILIGELYLEKFKNPFSKKN